MTTIVNRKHRCARQLLSLMAILGPSIGCAWADEPKEGFHGYFRIGTGSNSEKGSQACFGLEGVAKYRLGNECDISGDFGYTREFARSSDGTRFVGTAMLNVSSPTPHLGDNQLQLAQGMIEAKDIGFLNGGTAWIGRRYYNRPDIHVLDFKYVVMDGEGAGIDGIPMGPGKFSYALFRNDIDRSVSATRHNFTYENLPVNPNGTLKIDATFIRGDSGAVQRHNGWSLSFTHKQNKVLGGDNTLAVQYGVGPGIKIGGTGDLSLGSSFTRTRIAEQLIWQVTPEFSGSANLVVQRDRGIIGKQTWTSVGVRPVYALQEHVKLQLDIGHDRISPADGGPAQELTKITFAPTLSKGKDFWSRPELRLFITYAKWNKAAQAAARPGSPLSSIGVFGGSTDGVSFGVHFETWF